MEDKIKKDIKEIQDFKSDSIAEICEELQNMNPEDQIPVLIPSPCTADFEEKSSIEFIFRPMKEEEIEIGRAHV